MHFLNCFAAAIASLSFAAALVSPLPVVAAERFPLISDRDFGFINILSYALTKEVWPDDDLIAQFGPFAELSASKDRVSALSEEDEHVRSIINDAIGARRAADDALNDVGNAKATLVAVLKEFRPILETWSQTRGADAEAYFDKEVQPRRDRLASIRSSIARAEGSLAGYRQEAERLEKKARGRAAIYFQNTGDVSADGAYVAAAPLEDLYFHSLFEFLRAKTWRDRGAAVLAEKAASQTPVPSPGSGAPPAQSAAAEKTDVPSADAAAGSGPMPANAVLRLSGTVNQAPAARVNAGRDKNDPVMTLSSGAITLTFIDEPDANPRGGRVEITPQTSLTYIFDYHHPHPYERVDRIVSSCELKSARYASGRSDEVMPGLVGSFKCWETLSVTGQNDVVTTREGGLRLDFRPDPETGRNGWFLMFVGGPLGAEWKLQ